MYVCLVKYLYWNTNDNGIEEHFRGHFLYQETSLPSLIWYFFKVKYFKDYSVCIYVCVCVCVCPCVCVRVCVFNVHEYRYVWYVWGCRHMGTSTHWIRLLLSAVVYGDTLAFVLFPLVLIVFCVCVCVCVCLRERVCVREYFVCMLGLGREKGRGKHNWTPRCSGPMFQVYKQPSNFESLWKNTDLQDLIPLLHNKNTSVITDQNSLLHLHAIVGLFTCNSRSLVGYKTWIHITKHIHNHSLSTFILSESPVLLPTRSLTSVVSSPPPCDRPPPTISEETSVIPLVWSRVRGEGLVCISVLYKVLDRSALPRRQVSQYRTHTPPHPRITPVMSQDPEKNKKKIVTANGCKGPYKHKHYISCRHVYDMYIYSRWWSMDE